MQIIASRHICLQPVGDVSAELLYSLCDIKMHIDKNKYISSYYCTNDIS